MQFRKKIDREKSMDMFQKKSELLIKNKLWSFIS